MPLRIFLDTPCRPDKETHSAAEQVVRRALFAPSPCSRGVASETGGAGASPRKAFQLRKLWPKAGGSTAGLGGSRAKAGGSHAGLGGAKAGGSTAGLGGSQAKAGEATPA